MKIGFDGFLCKFSHWILVHSFFSLFPPLSEASAKIRLFIHKHILSDEYSQRTRRKERTQGKGQEDDRLHFFPPSHREKQTLSTFDPFHPRFSPLSPVILSRLVIELSLIIIIVIKSTISHSPPSRIPAHVPDQLLRHLDDIIPPLEQIVHGHHRRAIRGCFVDHLSCRHAFCTRAQ
jgi:hypothetical protein